MHRWTGMDIIAGKDLQAGGSWLGVKENKNNPSHPEIKFSALTNYRLAVNHEKPEQSQVTNKVPSRGALVINALNQGNDTLEQHLIARGQDYQGFNLVYGNIRTDQTQLFCFDSIKRERHHLTKGFHSICNGALDDIWPKMARGKKLLEDYIKQSPSLDIEHLFKLMKDDSAAPDHLLPDTGVPFEWEQRLSSIFIQSTEYGTRSTCIITFDVNSQLNIHQREFNQQGQVKNEVSFEL